MLGIEAFIFLYFTNNFSLKSSSPGSFPPMQVPRARSTRVENILALALTWLNLKHYFKSPLFMREKQAIQFLSFLFHMSSDQLSA